MEKFGYEISYKKTLVGKHKAPNMFEVFNSVLKGAQSLQVTALVKLTFFKLNSYFVARRE